jgi:hypothetical protein
MQSRPRIGSAPGHDVRSRIDHADARDGVGETKTLFGGVQREAMPNFTALASSGSPFGNLTPSRA